MQRGVGLSTRNFLNAPFLPKEYILFEHRDRPLIDEKAMQNKMATMKNCCSVWGNCDVTEKTAFKNFKTERLELSPIDMMLSADHL